MLVVFKILFLLSIFTLSTMIGVIIAKRYSNRVTELQDVIELIIPTILFQKFLILLQDI